MAPASVCLSRKWVCGDGQRRRPGRFWLEKLKTKVCDFSLGVGVGHQDNRSMAKSSTDMQNFSTFAALHRADLTHEPLKAIGLGVPWGRIALIAIGSVVAALVLRVLAAW